MPRASSAAACGRRTQKRPLGSRASWAFRPRPSLDFQVYFELPIAEQVQRVLHEEITPVEGLQALMAREQKPEYPDEPDGAA